MDRSTIVAAYNADDIRQCGIVITRPHCSKACLLLAALALSSISGCATNTAYKAPNPTGGEAVQEQPNGVEWHDDWGRANWVDYTILGGAATLITTNLILGPSKRRATGGWLFDEGIRDRLRASPEVERRIARDASDVLLVLQTSYPLLIDAITVTGWFHGNADTATELAILNTEVVAITLALQTTANIIMGRERPYGRTCGKGLSETVGYCDSRNRHYSFFSGHTAQSFAAAALTCTNHQYLPLYGKGERWVPCAVGFTLAATTGVLRIVGDQHYTTDVLTGAAIGTLTGFLVPYLLRYRSRGTTNDAQESSAVKFTLVPHGAGLGVVGYY